MSPAFFSIGHSTRGLDAFVSLLRVAGVERVVDIRTVPRSRTNPQYNADTFPAVLKGYGIDWDRIAKLGGLRGRTPGVSPELNGWWQNSSFHRYADYAMGDDFQDGLQQLINLGREMPTAMMCAEAVWWRCHRRIVADHLLARGETVFHLLGEDRVEAASLSAGAVISDGRVTYPSEPV